MPEHFHSPFKRVFDFFIRPRFWIGLAVSGLWISVMAAMWMRETGRMGVSMRRMGVSPEVLLVSWIDIDQWLWIEQNGRRAGLSWQSIQREGGEENGEKPQHSPGYVLNSRKNMTLELMGINLPLDLASSSEVNSAFELQTMQARLQAAGQQVLIQAFTEDNRLYYRLRLGAAPREAQPEARTEPEKKRLPNSKSLLPFGLSFPIPALGGFPALPAQDLCGWSPLAEPIFVSDAVLPVLIRSESPRPGQTWTTEASDPLQGLARTTVQVRVEGRETLTLDDEVVDALKISQQVGPVKSITWYDGQGRVLRAEMNNGLRMVKADSYEGLKEMKRFDRLNIFQPLDRDWIKEHVDPKLAGKPLETFLPALPES